MAGKTLSRDMWEQLIAEYSRFPEQHAKVAKLVGVTTATAKKYWSHPGQQTWCTKSIEQILEDERVQIRAARVTAQLQAEAEIATAYGILDAALARTDRHAQRVKELEVVGLVKSNVIDLLALISDLLGQASILRNRLGEMLLTDEFQERLKNNPQLTITLVRELGRLVEQGTKSAEIAVKLERLIVGEPTERKAIHFENAEDAARAIKRASEAVQRQGLSLVKDG